MLTLSPPLFPSFGWPLEEYPLSQQEQNSFCKDFSLETSDSLLPSPQSSSMPQAGAGGNGGDIINGMARKLNHNASERDRRKKINNLYSSLFSLLPAANRMKKLSIPATVSCAVKYIPELQKEVEKLVEKKEELSSRISKQQEDDVQLHHLGKRRKIMGGKSEKCCLSTISVNQVGANEVVIHMSSSLINNNIKSSLISETLNSLEDEDGLVLLNASSFESPAEKVFHNLHFQAQGNYKTDLEIIRRKVVLLAGEE